MWKVTDPDMQLDWMLRCEAPRPPSRDPFDDYESGEDEEQSPSLDLDKRYTCEPEDWEERNISAEEEQQHQEFNERIAMMREDHRGRAVMHCDIFADKWHRRVVREPSSLLRLRDMYPEDCAHVPKESDWLIEAKKLHREYEDTVWTFGDPPPPCGSRAFRVYIKRGLEYLEHVACIGIQEQKRRKTQSGSSSSSEKPAELPQPPRRPGPIFSEQFLTRLFNCRSWEDWMPPSA
jgi:hypothetical protein